MSEYDSKRENEQNIESRTKEDRFSYSVFEMIKEQTAIRQTSSQGNSTESPKFEKFTEVNPKDSRVIFYVSCNSLLSELSTEYLNSLLEKNFNASGEPSNGFDTRATIDENFMKPKKEKKS